MSAQPARTGTPLVAIAGNPNTGKTTLFNVLTGSSAKVGNYPGITVERHEGKLALPKTGSALVIDVPGTYSLSARSEEERIALEAIAGLGGNPRPDLVVVVVDATQLSRNLYLALQVIELGMPVVIALSMVDVVAKKHSRVDEAAIAAELGVPVVGVTAVTRAGLEELRTAIDEALVSPTAAPVPWAPSAELQEYLDPIAAELPAAWDTTGPREAALSLWALLSLDGDDEHAAIPEGLRRAVLASRTSAEAAGRNLEQEIIETRYAWIDARSDRFHPSGERRLHDSTDRFDRVLLHPVAGFGIFLVMMTVVFQALFSWSDPMIGAVEGVVGSLGSWVGGQLPDGLFRDLVVEGLFGGVGAVLVFLPQILLLFLFVGVMEDSGYMSRVAFLMDRVMRLVGLHGRAFVPMLSGFACAVPAIVATRTMERTRDRLLTMRVVPLWTC
ncbi:MAG: ferrous iron transport protein B, partial [Planctomycetota bacterium]|nr:ferrous iron transport protein B [Planctomycetota bacterium]